MKNIVHDFMEATYPKNLPESPQVQGQPQPPLELPVPAGAALIPLPAPRELNIPALDLRTAIERRQSCRTYQEQPLALEELSYLLWLTQGVKRVTGWPATLRTVPSAGARHAFETYLLVNNVAGLELGLYRFVACEHALLKLDTDADTPGITNTVGIRDTWGIHNIREQITGACGGQRQIYHSAVTFLWVAVAERMVWRYVERGYRYLHLDAGHVCQNLYLAAEAIDCGVCAIAAYDDEMLNAVLGLDGRNLFVIYLASLGKK